MANLRLIRGQTDKYCQLSLISDNTRQGERHRKPSKYGLGMRILASPKG